MLDGGQPISGTFAHVARLDPIKDHDTLFAALRMARDAGHDVRIICAGRNAVNNSTAFDELLDRHGVAEAVRGLGQTHGVEGVYGMADAFVLSSVAENTPIVVVEALAAGLPVVSTDVGNVAEAIGNLGVVVPTRDPAALAAAMIRVLGDYALRERAMRQGPSHVRDHYSPDTLRIAWNDMLDARTPPTTVRSMLARSRDWLHWRLKESVPPLRLWIMAVIAFGLSAIVYRVAHVMPVQIVKTNLEWLSMVLYAFGLWPALSHIYLTLVGGVVDKAIEIIGFSGGAVTGSET